MAADARVRLAFARAAASYDQAAHLQRETGHRLLARVGDGLGGRVLDLGCGTGMLADALLASPKVSGIIALDLAMPMLAAARARLAGGPVGYVCADAEHLPLAAASVDAVVSNLMLQWCARPGPVFGGLAAVLRPGGALAFTTFGDGTLQELKNAWAAVDGHPHVNRFHSQALWLDWLRQAGFVRIRCEQWRRQLRYPTAYELLFELKRLGAHTVLAGRKRQLTSRRQLQAMAQAYLDQGGGQVIASYQLLMFSAERPAGQAPP